MTIAEAPLPHDDNEHMLTSGQRERLHHEIGRLYESSLPKLNFKFPQLDIGAGAIARIADDVSKFSRVAMPETLLTNLASASLLSAQNAMLLDQMKPIVDAMTKWQQMLPVINSDTLRLLGQSQSNFNAIAAQLVRSIDFGWTDRFAQIAKQWADRQYDWLKAITPALAKVLANFFPGNLQGIDGLRLEDVEQVVMLDGIALYGIPRAEIAERLINAESSSARREILGRKWREIAADCRALLGSCLSSEAAPMIGFANDAVDALEAGNTTAAQALVSSLLDTILRKYLPKTKPLLVPGRKAKTADAYDAFSARQYIALAPIWQAYQNYYPDDGDRAPRTFNRHATAHTVGSLQYSRRNAVQGLMLVCGLLKFLDEQATAQAAA